MAKGCQMLLRSGRAVKNSDVRAVDLGIDQTSDRLPVAVGTLSIWQSTTDLVPRERVKVNPQFLHIDLPVRRQRHPINTQHRPWHPVHLLCNPLDIMYCPQDIARMRTRHQFRLLAQQRSQVLRCKLNVTHFGGRCPPFYGKVKDFGKTDPGSNVGFVVDRGEHQFGVGRERKSQGLGEVGEELGRRRPDDWWIDVSSDKPPN